MRRLLFDRSMLMVGMSLPDRSGVVAIRRRRRRRGRHLWSILLMPYFFRFIYLFIFVVDRYGVPLVQCRHIRYTLNIFSICGTHSHIADVYDTKEKEREEREREKIVREYVVASCNGHVSIVSTIQQASFCMFTHR